MIFTSSSTSSAAWRYGARVMLALGLVTVLGAASGCGSAPPPPPTGRVERGTVATQVSASGSLSAIREQNLGFPMTGQLKEVAVKVGQRVSPGQILARQDDFLLRQTLNQLQGQLNSQQALLSEALNDTTIHGDQASLEETRRIVTATEKSVDAELASDASAIRSAHKQLDLDSYTFDRYREQLHADQVSCSASGGVPSGGAGEVSAIPSRASNGSAGTGAPTSSGPNSSIGVGPAQAGVENPIKAGPVSAGVAGAGPVGGTGNGNPACNRIGQDQANVLTLHQQVLTDKSTLTAAVQKENVDRTQGLVSVENARQNVVTAQNALQAAVVNRPFTIDQQAALVGSIAAQVAGAQRNVDNTVLRAPVAGTVSVLNGAVGEWVQPSMGTSALAPGTHAPIPGLNGVTSSTSSTLGNPATGAQRPGGTQFLVLDNVNSFRVVVPFEESDAAKVAPNQQVNVTFDAIPDLTRTGTVLSVAPSGADISSVINYYVTVVLNETDPRLKDGQTAQVRVVTNQVDNVLTIPNSAVRRRGEQTTATVVDPNGTQEQVSFQAGLVGDTRTQIISGLSEGQQVVLRQGV
jgi:HlyD family secretion protein